MEENIRCNICSKSYFGDTLWSTVYLPAARSAPHIEQKAHVTLNSPLAPPTPAHSWHITITSTPGLLLLLLLSPPAAAAAAPFRTSRIKPAQSPKFKLIKFAFLFLFLTKLISRTAKQIQDPPPLACLENVANLELNEKKGVSCKEGIQKNSDSGLLALMARVPWMPHDIFFLFFIIFKEETKRISSSNISSPQDELR